MPAPLEDMIASRRLRWLSHLARMSDQHLPKQLLFGWLPQSRPPHGVKLRWRDKVRRDLKHFHIDEHGWYVVAQNRDDWNHMCVASPSLSESVQPRLFCDGCQRHFRKTEDMARHRCDSVRSRCTAGISGNTMVCSTCHQTFRRHQDLARHECALAGDDSN